MQPEVERNYDLFTVELYNVRYFLMAFPPEEDGRQMADRVALKECE